MHVRYALLASSLLAALAPLPVAAQDGSLLDEILVTGRRHSVRPEQAAGATRTQTRIEDIPQAIQVIPREVIDEQQITRLGDAVANVSNVQQGGTQGNRSELFMVRGFEVNSYAIDGILLSPAQNFTETVRDLANVAQVEVLKGPASVLYGRGEPGGTINIVTRRPSQDFGLEAAVQANDFGLRRGQLSVTGPLADTLAARVSMAGQETGSFRDDQADGARVFFAPTLAWRPGTKTRADIDYDYTYQTSPGDRGLVVVGNTVAGPVGRSFGEPWSKNYGRSHTIRGRIEHDVADWLTLRQIVSRQSGDSGRTVADFTGLSTDGLFVLRRGVKQVQQVSATTSQSEALVRFRTGPLEHLMLAGFEYVDAHRDTSEARATLARISIANPVQGAQPGAFVPARTIAVDARYRAGYVQDQIGIGDTIDILAGVRWDDVDQTTVDNGVRTVENGRRASPRLGLVWHPHPVLAIYGNWSTSFRPRSASIFGGGSAPPETGRQYEAGIKLTPADSRLIATAAVFDITKNNVSSADPDNSGFVVVTGQQRVRGAEIDLSGEILPGWRMIASAGYLDATVTRDSVIAVGNRLRGVPEFSASLWTTYRVANGPLAGMMLGAGATRVGEREGDLANTYRIPGYTRVDLTADYRIADRYRLGLIVRNVADTFYIEQPVARTTNYPGAPRTVSVRLAVEI
ncbi:iron complex outermembrane receptor protein [Sphingomonas sp. PP-CE-3G-477]|uniref:TonB-dependent siderophore receptor n=1 Tax=Sphingomonas sp. PP-CE-3G-477 TaxID=2135660 RepID=UPI000D3C0297|nr:TonB-dependent siderophore receptor [Sphingomonas sp. PP-CE-3G-477]PTQ64963.1 iron complex outermembrane receptor protein [Sphingomonas sp. PP-CE-3G-477]